VAEPPPRSRGVIWLGFAAVLVLALLFVYTLLRKEPVNVPHGLAGLRFGMSEAEARQRLPALAPNPAGKLAAKTDVFEVPAECLLEFDRSELSSIACTVAPAASADEQQKLKRRLVTTVRQLYGEESEWQSGPEERWSWQSSRARLNLSAGPGNVLRIENSRLAR
jgi:hypothetical protein